MADDTQGPNFTRILGTALLGIALVVAGFMGGQMVAEGSDTENSPRNWLGASFGGTVTAYEAGKSLSIKQDETEMAFELTPETRITAAKATAVEVRVGVTAQVKYKDFHSKKVAHTIRLLAPGKIVSATPRAETPGGTETPSESGTPAASASPAASMTPAGDVATPTMTPDAASPEPALTASPTP